MKQYESESVCGLVGPFVFHISATVELRSMHLAFMASSVRRSQADQPDNTLNDLVAWAMASAGIPISKELQGLSRSDGKRPDGLSLIPWQAAKPLTWAVKVVCPLADSYVAAVAREAGSIAELAAARKSANYTNLDSGYIFQPTAMNTLGPINDSARDFLPNLGRKISLQSGDDKRG